MEAWCAYPITRLCHHLYTLFQRHLWFLSLNQLHAEEICTVSVTAKSDWIAQTSIVFRWSRWINSLLAIRRMNAKASESTGFYRCWGVSSIAFSLFEWMLYPLHPSRCTFIIIAPFRHYGNFLELLHTALSNYHCWTSNERKVTYVVSKHLPQLFRPLGGAAGELASCFSCM